MLTLKFYRHPEDSYDVYSCERYKLSIEERPEAKEAEPNTVPLRTVVLMFRYLNDDNPYYASVGDLEPYGIAYVMNDAGKTIDTIR
jgi:hypothetical protein